MHKPVTSNAGPMTLIPFVDETKETEMDFIERIFGFFPDGGSGSLEFLLFSIPIAGVCYLAVRRRRRNHKPD